MRKVAILLILTGIAGAAGAAILTQGSIGRGRGVELPRRDRSCPGILHLNYDGSIENAYCWQYNQCYPPYYGAFAECYQGGDCVTGVELKLTGIGYPCSACDIYVWADDGGIPGAVLRRMTGFNPCPIATWPNVSTHDACLDPPCTIDGAPFWVGFFPTDPLWLCGYWVAADTNGPGGCPFTNIAPQTGYPTGWHDCSIVWGPTAAIGIGAWIGQGDACAGPVPTRESSWGRIKQTYE